MKQVLTIAFTLSAGFCFAQSKLSLQKGTKLEVATETKTSTSTQIMGQTIESTNTASYTEKYDVVDAANGNTTVEFKLKNLKFKSEGGMQDFSYDSDNPADAKSDIGKAIDPKLKAKYTLVLDNAGMITEIKEEKIKASSDEMVDMLLSQGSGMQLPKKGEAFSLHVLPARELKTGDQWEEEKKIDGGTAKTSYTVADLNDNEVIIKFTQTSDIATTQDMMGTTANVKATMNSKGTMTVDRKTGLLKSRTTEVEGTQNMEAQGMTIPITIKSTMTSTVKPS